jgi:malonate-semialdehyde dehydrogenase (acetylating)/methylmalonate-semialdehyde dehydrogenase
MSSVDVSVNRVANFVGGEPVTSQSGRTLPVTNPTTGEVIAEVPMTTAAELDEAVARAAEAQVGWGSVPVKDRVQVLFKVKSLMEEQTDRLAATIMEENGKTREEALGSILRAVECIEFASSMPQMTTGGILEVSPGVECRTSTFPLGVVAGITPFNFPLMVPLWMVPTALACGNAFVLKPSEQTPFSALELTRLFDEAGLPPGVFSVVNGDGEVGEAICDHPDIKAIGFVGSTRVAQEVYRRGTSSFKRVRAMGGAKNHVVVVPDADPEMTATNVVASVTGVAGQRCMAAAVLVAVGEVDHIIDRIRDKMSKIVAGGNMGPMISEEARQRVSGYIERAGEANLLLDARANVAAEASDGGYFIGPAIIDGVDPSHEASCEDNSPYGNAAAVYTSSGKVAQTFVEKVGAGMIGVNIGVPVPREPFAFGGWYDSRFGEGDITGFGAIDFWSQSKKITTKWSDEHRSNWMS